MTIVLVDTGTAVREQLAAPLHRAGVTLLQATSPKHALALAQAEQPEAVVINLTLAARAGDFAFSVLRCDPATAGLPVVFLIDRLRWGRRANDAAADAFVPIPWTPERVLAALHHALGRDTLAASPALAQEG